MRDDAIDRALRDEPEIHPSAGFSQRVMRSVRQEADRQGAIPFPWRQLGAGLALSAGVAIIGAITGDAPPEAALPDRFVYLAPALAWLSTALASSLGLAWWSLRFAGRGSATGSA